MIPQHPNPHVRQLLEIRAVFTAARNKLYEGMITLSEQLQASVHDTKTLIDIGFLCRDIVEISEDLRKEVAARQKACEYKIAYDLITRVAQGEEIEDPLWGLLASGSPGMKMEAVCPKPGTPENDAYLRFLGADKDSSGKLNGFVQPNWKKTAELISEMIARGQKLPAGINQTYPVYYTTFRRKSGLELDNTPAPRMKQAVQK